MICHPWSRTCYHLWDDLLSQPSRLSDGPISCHHHLSWTWKKMEWFASVLSQVISSWEELQNLSQSLLCIKFGSLVSSESYFLLQVWYLLLTFRFFNQLPLITLIQISFPLRISLPLSEDHLEGVLQHVNGSSSASSFLWLDGVILHDLIQYVPPHCYSSCSFFRSSPFDSIVDSVQNLFCSFSFDSMEDFPKVLFRRDVLLLIVVREVVFELRVLLEHSHVFILQTISWVNWFVHRFEIFHSDQLRWESHTYLCPSRTSFMNLTVVHQFPGR